MQILSEQHLRAILTEYQAQLQHCQASPRHRATRPDDERDGPCAPVTDIDNHPIRRKPILNGLINEYTHAV